MGDELLRSTGGETAAADETGGTQTTDFTDGENVPVQAGRGPKEGRSQKKPKAAKEKPHKEKKPKAAKEKKPKEKKLKEKKPEKEKQPKIKEQKKSAGGVKAQGASKRRGLHLSLKAQLIIGFVLPVLLVVCIGIYAYNKAEKGMVNNYRETALQALQMTTDYMNFGFETVSSSALELYNDGDVINYTRNLFKAVRVGHCQQYHNQKDCKQVY